MICLKHCFNFRLATTSFIYPADWATNVRRLSPWVDEVELLFFESHPQSLPTEKQIQDLTSMAADLDLTYNIHLPLDLDLTSGPNKLQHEAIERMADIIRLVNRLNPTTFTLHLNCTPDVQTPLQIAVWQDRCMAALSRMLDICSVDASTICAETLHYPPQWLTPFVKHPGISLCLDVGHILRYGYKLDQTIDACGDYIRIMHLHGVTNGQDHDSLLCLDRHNREILAQFLKTFHGSVSIEVFSAEKLDTSLRALEQMMAT